MKKYLFIIALFATILTMAQAPDKMSYQGVIRDASDVLISNTTVGMQISILEGSSTGTAVYVETHTPTTNANGLFSLEIGTGSVVLGDFSTINWSLGTYYLKTETDPTGGTSYSIEGTSQLLSVPFAMYANSAPMSSGNTLDEAYDEESGGSPSTRLISVDDGNIQLDASGSSALEINSDANFVGMLINGDSGGALELNASAGGDAIEIDVAPDGDNGIIMTHAGNGTGLEINSTNAANANDGIEITYNGTGNGLFVSTGGAADGVDVTYSGTAVGVNTVVQAGATGVGMKVLNNGNSDGSYIDNTSGTGDDGLQIDQDANGEALEINISATGNGDAIVINNGGAASTSLEVNNTNVVGANTAVFIDNAGNGKGLDLFNGNPGNASEAFSITQLGLGTALFVDNAGPGKGLHVFNGDATNADVSILANTMGTGSAGMFSTDDNNVNFSSTLAANTMGAGTVAEFVTIDEPVGKVNTMPTVNLNSNGKGVGLNIDILNASVGADINTEPALYVRHRGFGAAANFVTDPSNVSASSVKILNGGAGNGLHIDCFGSTTDFILDALHVEQSNESAFPTLGYAAFFELKSPTTAADSAVKISSVATAAGSSALRVIPADPTKLAAVFEGNVEVASDILIGGTMSAAAKAFKIDHPLDPVNKYLVHNSIESDKRINIYSGNIKTDAEGFATVVLPNYMCALNTDFKYQLTILDKSFAQAIIWETMNTDTNSFIIKTNAPEIKVSWQITGTRQDKWALENPLQVEVEKETSF